MVWCGDIKKDKGDVFLILGIKIILNKRCKDIISSIIQLSQSLDFQVIAEYVSTADIRNELADIGCYNYQGWFYSTAIPFEEFEKILKKGH